MEKLIKWRRRKYELRMSSAWVGISSPPVARFMISLYRKVFLRDGSPKQLVWIASHVEIRRARQSFVLVVVPDHLHTDISFHGSIMHSPQRRVLPPFVRRRGFNTASGTPRWSPHRPAQHLVVAGPTMHPLLQARNKLFSRTMRAHHLTADVCSSYSEQPHWFTSTRAHTAQNLSAGRALGVMMSTGHSYRY